MDNTNIGTTECPFNITVLSSDVGNWTCELGPTQSVSLLPEPFHISATGKTILFIAYGFICVTALVGNILVLWLILGARRMWIVTNIFLVNLSVADIVISLFTIPFQFQAALLQRWELPHFLCPICPFVQAVSVLVSVLTLSAIALNRYKAIMNPLIVKTSKKDAIAIIILIWTLSVTISAPVYIDFSVISDHNRNWTVTRPRCMQTWLSSDERFYYSQLLVLSQYFIPLAILTWVYSRMAFYIWGEEALPSDKALQRDALFQKRKRRVTKMMAAIVTLFGLCWMPYQLYNILIPYFPQINEYQHINVIWFFFHWLAMSNSCCNPFVCVIFNASFRNEFRRRTNCFGRLSFKWICIGRTVREGDVYEMNQL